MPEFTRLFLKEQSKLRQTEKNGHRYSPKIIEFAMRLFKKSPQAYREVRHDSKTGYGLFVLPNERHLKKLLNSSRLLKWQSLQRESTPWTLTPHHWKSNPCQTKNCKRKPHTKQAFSLLFFYRVYLYFWFSFWRKTYFNLFSKNVDLPQK